MIEQPTFFDAETKTVEPEKLVLYALGEFQARKKQLAGRELPLDRLKGAFRRAAEAFKTTELSDEALAEHLQNLGAKVVRVPQFVAKHPFRITVDIGLSERGLNFYQEAILQNAETKI